MPKHLTIAEAQETLPELVSSLNSDGGQCPPYISGDRSLMKQLRSGIGQADAGETISLEELKAEL